MFGLHIFFPDIKYTNKDRVIPKVRHYPLLKEEEEVPEVKNHKYEQHRNTNNEKKNTAPTH